MCISFNMLLQTWSDVFVVSFQNLWLGIVSFVPNLIVAILIFIIGWVIGSVVGKAISQVIASLKIDRLFHGTGLEEMLSRAGTRLSVGGFFGWIIKWFIIVVFLMASLEIIGLAQVNTFLREVVLTFLPNVIIAAFVLVIATVVADAMRKLVVGGAKAANVRSANMLGTITVYAIWVFAFIIALSELGIAAQFMQILFTGIIAMLAIAGGLAFGLGGKEAAGRTVDKFKSDISH
jgi:hypothetical protein